MVEVVASHPAEATGTWGETQHISYIHMSLCLSANLDSVPEVCLQTHTLHVRRHHHSRCWCSRWRAARWRWWLGWWLEYGLYRRRVQPIWPFLDAYSLFHIFLFFSVQLVVTWEVDDHSPKKIWHQSGAKLLRTKINRKPVRSQAPPNISSCYLNKYKGQRISTRLHSLSKPRGSRTRHSPSKRRLW